ncbi:hypothetical protein ACWDCZ_41335, partial [Kitasatospora sp. NPDC001225]
MRPTEDCAPLPGGRLDPAVIWRNRALRLMDHVPMPIAVCEFGGQILIVNRAMAAEFGCLPGQLRHRRILEFFTLRDTGTLEALTEAVQTRPPGSRWGGAAGCAGWSGWSGEVWGWSGSV